jgi:multiple sugar transport system ATP-binding protein
MGDRVAVMNVGVLQQVDTPQRLYEHPGNLFVAGFIGTPPMNLLEARVSVNGGVTVDLGGNTLPIPDQALANYPRLPQWDGRTVIAGLRPVHPSASERPDLPTLDARVDLVRRSAPSRSPTSGSRPAQSGTSRSARTSRKVSPRVPSGRGRTSSRSSRRTSYGSVAGSRRRRRQRLHFFDAESGDPLR